MNETLKTIFTRRSTRKFTDKPIPAEDLEQIVQAALHAPSGMGRMTWQFTVIKNREKIKELAEVIAKVIGRRGYNMYQPDILVIPSNDRESGFGKEDNACALENMFLAAQSLGIGSVWLNQLHGICDEPLIRKMLDSFDIPKNHVVYGFGAFGYGDDAITDKERRGKVVVVE